MEPFMPTFVNTVAVIIGSLTGLALHNKLEERFRIILFQVLGLLTILIGLRDAMGSEDIPILALSLIAGAMMGEYMKMEEYFSHLGKWLYHAFAIKSRGFSEGFITASILFCVGGMTIVGSFQAGVNANGELLYTKALLDGHAALFLAGAMGYGVLFSALTVFIVQGTLTLLFMFTGSFISPELITEVTAMGGLLILGIGLNLLGIVNIRTGNLLPALIFIVVLSWGKTYIMTI